MINLRTSRVIGSIVLCFIGFGCQLPRALTADDLDTRNPAVHVRTLKLLDGSELDCRSDSLGYAEIQDSVIVLRGRNGNVRCIPLDSVARTGGTRYPTSPEIATRTLILGCSLIALILWMIANPIKFNT
jgi:hypothetical protein